MELSIIKILKLKNQNYMLKNKFKTSLFQLKIYILNNIILF